MDISLVIPIVNEEESLKRILNRLPRCVSEVVVVDSFSSDKSIEVASSLIKSRENLEIIE
jgi:glycosyltransferase involved in cell wall biosynthesis